MQQIKHEIETQTGWIKTFSVLKIKATETACFYDLWMADISRMRW